MINGKSVSLCMVIWNSSDLAVRAITSVMSIVDEVVIIDQGSSEEHSTTLKSLANVYMKVTNKGNADYDRQYCYSLATKDYILAMDADEILTEENLVRLSDAVTAYDFEVMWFQFINKVSYGKKIVDLEKMLKNDPHPRLWKRVVIRGGQESTPMLWPQKAHEFPKIDSQRIVFCECYFDHIRNLSDVIRTHLHRGKNIEPEAREIEKNFIRAVLNEFGLETKKEIVKEFPELTEYLR